MNRESSPKAQSILKRLSNYALSVRVPFEYILTSFLLERLVIRLTRDKKLSSNLIFKGGYVGLRVYNSPRYTIDLDVLLINRRIDEVIDIVKIAATAILNDDVWFSFDKTVDLLTQGEYPGTRIVFRAGVGKPLKDIKRAQVIHLDIGVGDVVMPMSIETPYILGEGNLSWLVYPPETIVAEKLHAVFVRGSANSRSKDLLDLKYLLPLCSHELLRNALRSTFRNRGDILPKELAHALKTVDFTLMRRGWKSACESSSKAESFDAVLECVAELLKDIL